MLAGETALGASALVVAATLSTSEEWREPWLVVLLLGLAIASDLFPIRATRNGLSVSGSFLAIVLAMALVGPAGAVLVGAGSALAEGVRERRALTSLVNNVSTYAAFPLTGALVLEGIADGFGAGVGDVAYAGAVLAAFAVSLGLNFILIAGHQSVLHGRPIEQQVRDLVLPFLPSELLSALLGATIVSLYPHLGVASIVLFALVLLGFQYMLRELRRSQERAERLQAIQVDVLFSMVNTLSLRDQMTARHSAAVARFAQAIARAAGASRAEQELVHTAGLLHDIGKSIFPDHVLFANGSLTDEQWEIVRQHPAHGAAMIAQIEEFGPVAELVHAHHERIDGRGYPDGLAGDEVPWLSRMLSIADTYDVMTSRDSYREPVTPELAVAELRRVSGTQLDGELVEIFVDILVTEGIDFTHQDDSDLERELDEHRRALATFASAPAAG
jgi:putative nucleotidyltransferase with HDIG domain